MPVGKSFALSGRCVLRLLEGLRGAVEHDDYGLEHALLLRPGDARGRRWHGTRRLGSSRVEINPKNIYVSTYTVLRVFGPRPYWAPPESVKNAHKAYKSRYFADFSER